MVEWMEQLLNQFGEALQSVLPLSPFRSYIDELVVPEWFAVINWLFPVGECIAILTAWVTAYGVYVLYRIILRWIKAVS